MSRKLQYYSNCSSFIPLELTICKMILAFRGFPGSLAGKKSACDAGDPGSIPGVGRSPGERIGYHSSILAWRIPKDRGAWRAIVHGVTKS